MLNAQQACRIQWKTATRAPDLFKKPKGTQKSGLYYLPHPVSCTVHHPTIQSNRCVEVLYKIPYWKSTVNLFVLSLLSLSYICMCLGLRRTDTGPSSKPDNCRLTACASITPWWSCLPSQLYLNFPKLRESPSCQRMQRNLQYFERLGNLCKHSTLFLVCCIASIKIHLLIFWTS